MVVETSRDVIYETLAANNPEVIPVLQDRIFVGINVCEAILADN